MTADRPELDALPADVTIEAATTDDADAAIDLWVDLAADQRQYGSQLLPAANRESMRETILQHAVTATAVVARRGDDVVGFVTFQPEPETLAQDVPRGVVTNLYVRDADRGEGVGSALLAVAETTLVERGAERIALEVLATNEAARTFYRRRGYDPHRIELEKTAESDTLTLDDG